MTNSHLEAVFILVHLGFNNERDRSDQETGVLPRWLASTWGHEKTRFLRLRLGGDVVAEGAISLSIFCPGIAKIRKRDRSLQ
jgi:hypothetical protein